MAPQTLFNKAATSTSKVSQTVAKNAVREVGETLKRSADQLVPLKNESSESPEQNSVPAVVQEIRDQGPQIDVEQIHAEERARIAELEKQLLAIRQRGKEQLNSYNERVTQEMNQKQNTAPVETAVAQGKPNHNPGVMGKVKKAVSSILSGKRGETKAGSGKG